MSSAFCAHCAQKNHVLRVLQPLMSARAFAGLQCALNGAQKRSRKQSTQSEQTPLQHDEKRAALSAVAALREQTVKSGGVHAHVWCSNQPDGWMPDPVRRQSHWQPILFVECASVAVLSHRVDLQQQRLHMRMQFRLLLTRGFAPTPHPRGSHTYNVQWPPPPPPLLEAANSGDDEHDNGFVAVCCAQAFPPVIVHLSIDPVKQILQLDDCHVKQPAVCVHAVLRAPIDPQSPTVNVEAAFPWHCFKIKRSLANKRQRITF